MSHDARARVLNEIGLLVAVAAVQLGGTAFAAAHRTPVRHLDLLGWGLLVAGILALGIRHRYPPVALTAVFITTATYLSLGFPKGPIWAPLIVALAQCVITGHRRAAIASLVAGYVVFLWVPYALGNEHRPTAFAQVGLAAWLVALTAVIEVVYSRRERARASARSALETERRQAADERLRIARDVHDAVAHNMSLINIQASVALHLMDDHPEQARDALTTIKAASKDALVELRAILGVLRQADDERRAPLPSLTRIDELVAQAALSGVDVELRVTGDLNGLPLNVDLAAYRIVQESLTNVARHAQSRDAIVRIHAHDGALDVEILDEGTPNQHRDSDLPSGGSGIAGMRERALAVGGRLTAGPRPGRGFAVRAELPIATPS